MFKNKVGRPKATYDKEIAFRIGEAREQAGLTKEELGQKLGEIDENLRVEPRTVWNWEKARTNCPHKTLDAIAEICGVDPDWLKNKREENHGNPAMVSAIREHYEEREYLSLLLEGMGHDLSDHKLKFRKFEEYLMKSINNAIEYSDLSFEEFMAKQVTSSIELYNLLHKKG